MGPPRPPPPPNPPNPPPGGPPPCSPPPCSPPPGDPPPGPPRYTAPGPAWPPPKPPCCSRPSRNRWSSSSVLMPNIPTPEVLPEIDTDYVAASAATPGTGIPDGTI